MCHKGGYFSCGWRQLGCFVTDDLDSHPTGAQKTELHARTSTYSARDAVTFAALLVGSELVARVTGALEAAQSVYTSLLTSTIVWLGTLILLWKTRTSVHVVRVCVRSRIRAK